MKSKLFTLAFLATAFLFSRCNKTVVLGQTYKGGIVFYIDGTGKHGLVAATADQPKTEYGCEFTDISGAKNSIIGKGQDNTKAILDNCPGTSAARLCSDLKLAGYSDWFLPSKEELMAMFNQKSTLGLTELDKYWSSTQAHASAAWVVYSSGGIFSIGYSPAAQCRVRPVRAF